MELATVLAAVARETNMAIRAGRFEPDETARREGATTSLVAVLARDEADLALLDGDPAWQPVDPAGTEAWTDGYSNVLTAILRKPWRQEGGAE